MIGKKLCDIATPTTARLSVGAGDGFAHRSVSFWIRGNYSVGYQISAKRLAREEESPLVVSGSSKCMILVHDKPLG